jgi:hypothetical protein
MRLRLCVLVLMVGLFSNLLPAAAQDVLALDETFTTEDGRISFDYPADWALEEGSVSEGEYLDMKLGNSAAVLEQFTDVFGSNLSSGQLYMELAVGELSQVTDGMEGVTAESSMTDILELVFLAADQDEFEFGEITELEIGGHPAGRIDAETRDGGEGFVLLIDFGGGIIGGTAVGTASGGLDDWEPTVLAIVESMEVEITADDATPEATESPEMTLTETVTNRIETLVVHYPAGWLTDESGDEGVYLAPDQESLDHSFGDAFASGEVEILVSIGTVETLIEDMGLTVEADAGALKILQGTVKLVTEEGGGEITFEPVEQVSVDDLPAAVTRFTSREFEGTAWAIEYAPGIIMVVQLLAAPEEAAEWEALTLAIVEAAQYPG